MEELLDRTAFLAGALKKAARISTWLFSSDRKLIGTSEEKWREELANFFLLELEDSVWENAGDSKDRMVQRQDRFSMCWFVLSGEHVQRLVHDAALLVIGPSFPTEVSNAYFVKAMDARGMTVRSRTRFLQMTKGIPFCSRSQLYQYAQMFCYALGTEIAVVENSTAVGSSPDSKAPKERFFRQVETHGSSDVEAMLMETIRTGNIAAMRTAGAYANSESHPGILSPGNPVRDVKDNLIVLCAISSRAAIQGGLTREEAMTISDYYIQQIEAVDSIEELDAIARQIFPAFVREVHRKKEEKTYSPPVRFALDEINRDIFREIRAKEIAEKSGYALYYLTALFKDEVGVSMREYVLHRKLDTARTLLETTTLSIGTIAERLSFSNRSFFCTSFRKYTGMTPTQCREKTSEQKNRPAADAENPESREQKRS